jgi:hypothetical protein
MNDIEPIIFEDIENFFDWLEKRPSFSLEYRTIEELIGFINGYLLPYSLKPNSNNPWALFNVFGAWLQDRFPNEWPKDGFNKLSFITLMKIISEKENNTPYEQFWKEWSLFKESELFKTSKA